MFTQLGNVLLIVSDLERAVDFYTTKLGLSIKLRESGYVEFGLDGASLSVVDVNEASKMLESQRVRFPSTSARDAFVAVKVPDVARAYAELSANGVGFVKAPFTQPWGQVTAYFSDPDGHLWEIHS